VVALLLAMTNGGAGLRAFVVKLGNDTPLARAVHAHRDTAARRVRDPHAAAASIASIPPT